MKNKIKLVFILTFIVLAIHLLPLKSQTLYVPGGAGGIGNNTTNGNVGIGTNTPAYKLNVLGDHVDSRILLHSTGGGGDSREADLMLWASEPGWTYDGTGIGNNVVNVWANGTAINRINSARGGSYLRLLNNALTLNVVSQSGVDKSALSINGNGDITATNMLFLNIHNSAQIRLNSSGTYYGKIGNPSAQIWSLGYGNDGSEINSVLCWTASGNVLINKTSQSNLTYKLDVAGKIRADEIVVNTTGADFVFEPTYKLRTLSELETFIRINKHLPDIAPAKEMQVNGVSAGEMQTKLLQKVEELTIYIIEQNKRIAELETQLKEIKSKQ